MESEISGSFSSPVIQKNTPIKRLGLSRKRKSCGSEKIPTTKVQAISEGCFLGDVKSEYNYLQNANETKEIKKVKTENDSTDEFDDDISLKKKMNELIEEFPLGGVKSECNHLQNTNETKEIKKMRTENDHIDGDISFKEKMEGLIKRIEVKEEKLKVLERNKSRILELQSLFDLWKNGCKSTFLHLIELLKEKQSEEVDPVNVMKRLGIWEIMCQHFEDDSEISLSKSSQ